MNGIYLMKHYSGTDSTKALSKDISAFYDIFEKSKPRQVTRGKTVRFSTKGANLTDIADKSVHSTIFYLI